MTDLVITVIDLAVVWCATFITVYALCTSLLVFVIGPVLRWRDRRRQARERRVAAERELARIDQAAAASVQRIHAAFQHAHRLVRDEAGRRQP